jgi:hypothetical protein
MSCVKVYLFITISLHAIREVTVSWLIVIMQVHVLLLSSNCADKRAGNWTIPH